MEGGRFASLLEPASNSKGVVTGGGTAEEV